MVDTPETGPTSMDSSTASAFLEAWAVAGVPERSAAR